MEIIEATAKHLHIIQEIAEKTWPHTFAGILSKEQITYMLNWMYSIESLTEQTTVRHHHFVLARIRQEYLGYASYETDYKGRPVTKIHKLYLLPQSQGKGTGRKLINHIGIKAREAGNSLLMLNVNKNNSALEFYKKTGFEQTGTEVIDIGDGFKMEDIIMEAAI